MLERKDILKLAKLSRLELDDADVDSVSTHLGKLLDHMESLRALDLSDVEPMTGAEEAETVLRPDVVVPGVTHEQAALPAPKVDNGHFATPPGMGGQ